MITNPSSLDRSSSDIIVSEAHPGLVVVAAAPERCDHYDCLLVSFDDGATRRIRQLAQRNSSPTCRLGPLRIMGVTAGPPPRTGHGTALSW